jgi:hypothetical protein
MPGVSFQSLDAAVGQLKAVGAAAGSSASAAARSARPTAAASE